MVWKSFKLILGIRYEVKVSMKRRVLWFSLIAVFIALVLLGFLVNSIFFYVVLVLAMIIMHLFGHRHGHEREESENQHETH